MFTLKLFFANSSHFCYFFNEAMELLAKKVGASKHVIEKGVQVMEENMARAINEFLLESMQEDAL